MMKQTRASNVAALLIMSLVFSGTGGVLARAANVSQLGNDFSLRHLRVLGVSAMELRGQTSSPQTCGVRRGRAELFFADLRAVVT